MLRVLSPLPMKWLLKSLSLLLVNVGMSALVLTQVCIAGEVNAPQKKIINDSMKQVDAAMQEKSFKDELAKQQKDMGNAHWTPKGLGLNVPKSFYQDGEKFKKIPELGAAMSPIPIEKNDYPLAFASFSLPKNTLVTLLQDMKRVGGAVIFRGLIDNDFKKTMQAVRDLGAQDGGALIDPTLFQRFNVSNVPTFVVPLEAIENCELDVQKDCPMPKNFKAVGDVSFGFLLDLVERTGSSEEKAVAKTLNSVLRKPL